MSGNDEKKGGPPTLQVSEKAREREDERGGEGGVYQRQSVGQGNPKKIPR